MCKPPIASVFVIRLILAIIIRHFKCYKSIKDNSLNIMKFTVIRLRNKGTFYFKHESNSEIFNRTIYEELSIKIKIKYNNVHKINKKPKTLTVTSYIIPLTLISHQRICLSVIDIGLRDVVL